MGEPNQVESSLSVFMEISWMMRLTLLCVMWSGSVTMMALVHPLLLFNNLSPETVSQPRKGGLSSLLAHFLHGVCQVNITAFTNVTTNNFIPDTYTFSHKVLVWGGGNNAAAASHVQRGDYAVTSSWDYFSDFVSTIPAGVNIPTGKTARRRFRVKEAPPAGKYIMDVNIQIKGTTVGTDLVTCTAGIVPIGADTITQPRIIDYRTRAVSDFADGSARFLRDDMDSWFPAGSVKVQHLRRIYELGNNQTPPEIMVVCKNLNTPTKKRSLDAAMETEQSVGRSVAVGPIIVSFYRADTPWVLDSVVMNYRFGNIVTKTPN